MSYNMTNELQNLSKEMFPYPLKMIRWLTEFESFVNKFLFPFPSPLEVTGVSYISLVVLCWCRKRFPSPLEVTGVSYPISCIGSSRQTTRSSLTSQLKLILIIP